MSTLRVLVDVITKGDASLNRLSSGLDESDRKARGLKGQLERIPAPVRAIGGAFLAAGIIDVLGDAAEQASGLAEATSKANVVFEDGAPALHEWAESTSQIGLSRRDATEAAATYGNLFRAFGIGQERAQGMSVSLVELAADMASFNNTSIDDALQALRSGLSGETEPLKRFGVALTDARLREIALAEGIYDGVGALDAAQKAQAAYTLILRDTALAQGDFERTSDGLANSQRRVQAEIENAMASLGQEVASIQLGAIRVAEFLGQEFNPWEPVAERWNQDFGDILDTVDEFVFGVDERMVNSASDSFIAAHAATEGIAQAYIEGRPVVAKEAGKIAGLLPSEIRANIQDIRNAAVESVVAFSDTLLDRNQLLVDAAVGLVTIFEDQISTAEAIARATGEDVVANLQAGLRSNDPAIRLAMQGRLEFIIAELNKLGPAGYAAGVALLNNIGYGLADPNALGYALQQARQAAGVITAPFPYSEPKDPLSPLRNLDQVGVRIVDSIASGITHRLSVAENASQRLSGALTPSLSTGVDGLRLGAEGGGMGVAAYHTHIHLSYSGDPPTSENDLVALLEQVAPFVDGRLRLGN